MTEYLLSAGICMAIVSILLIGMAISNVSKGQYAKRFFFFATSCLVLTLVVISNSLKVAQQMHHKQITA